MSRRTKSSNQFARQLSMEQRKLKEASKNYSSLDCCQNMAMPLLIVHRIPITFAWIWRTTRRRVSNLQLFRRLIPFWTHLQLLNSKFNCRCFTTSSSKPTRHPWKSRTFSLTRQMGPICLRSSKSPARITSLNVSTSRFEDVNCCNRWTFRIRWRSHPTVQCSWIWPFHCRSMLNKNRKIAKVFRCEWEFNDIANWLKIDVKQTQRAFGRINAKNSINFHSIFNFPSTANVMDEERRVVARRNFLMDPKGARCLCLWFCTCFCFGSFLTTQATDLCHMMSPKNEIYAGFYDEKELMEVEEEEEQSLWLEKHFTALLPLLMFFFAFLLGKLIWIQLWKWRKRKRAFRQSSAVRLNEKSFFTEKKHCSLKSLF